MAQATTTVGKLTSAPQAVVRYIKESYAELKKVSWPTRETTIRYTVIVIISSLALGAITGGVDYVLTTIIEQLVI